MRKQKYQFEHERGAGRELMNRSKARLLSLVLVTALGHVGYGADAGRGRGEPKPEPVSGSATEPRNTMKISLQFQDKTMTATLIDNETARDFVSLLPLTLTLKDYAATEKISDLPKKLSTRDAPRGYEPSAGDIAYYAPWGNLAIFYKDAGYARGLIPLGRIDSGIEALSVPGPLKATIERVEK
jgi:hypothetical protein